MNNHNTEGSYRIGIYVRESRDDNEENYDTIETQKNLLVDFASKCGMGSLKRIYIDDNISGSTFNRQGIELLKQDALKNEIDLVIVKDLSRLGRNNAKTLMFLDFLEECGVRLVSFDGRYDSSRDNETVGIETWFNERYVRDVSKKIRANIRYKIEKGEYIGHAPFGYIKSNEEKNRLCIDKDSSHVIREIYDKYKEGYGYNYIANYLNLLEYVTPSGRKNHNKDCKWNAVAVRRILTNQVYKGDTVQGISERISFKSKKTRRLNPDKWVITRGTHEPIIRSEEFEEVQILMSQRGMASGSHKGILHLLRDIAYCGRCGSSMYARTRKNKPMGYVCSKYFKTNGNKCTSHFLKESDVLTVIVDEIRSLLGDNIIITKLETMFEKDFLETCNYSSEIQRLEQLLFSKQKQQDILYTDKLESKISEQLFLRMNKNIENRIDQLRYEIKKNKERSMNTSEYKGVIKGVSEYINQFGITNEIVKLLIEKITVFDSDDNLSENNLNNINYPGGIILLEFRI